MAMLVTSLLLAVVTPVPAHDAHDPVLAQVQTELVFQDEHMSRRERCMANKKCRAKRHRIHQIFRYCNTWSCVKRVRKIHERRYDRMRRRYTRPYRSWLYSTRMCESGGNYATNTGNGFYGAYQFTISTWHWAGPCFRISHRSEPARWSTGRKARVIPGAIGFAWLPAAAPTMSASRQPAPVGRPAAGRHAAIRATTS